MDVRIAILNIAAKDAERVMAVNDILCGCGADVMGCTWFPCPEKNMHILCVPVCAPQDTVSAVAGKIGSVKGVSVKTVYPKIEKREAENNSG